ncbi:MAG: uroporphyrinogen-III synthase [Legionellaceae bacterium]|nr:uroporphyrinogen-III synthase [Legionellaceae bacterium]
MSTTINLHGLRILNSRPSHQAEKLDTQLAAAGALSISLPVMHIQALDAHSWSQKMPGPNQVDAAIFTSSNAVYYFFKHWQKPSGLWPAATPVVAIGPATAHSLLRYGIEAVTPAQSDSEHLLRLPLWSAKKEQTVLLIGGRDGRPLIRDCLRQDGHQLIELAVYQRQQRSLDPMTVHKIWQNDAVDIILGASAFAIEALFDSFGQPARPWLQSKTWLVFSQRLKAVLQQNGVRSVLVSNSDRILETLFLYRQGLMNGNK